MMDVIERTTDATVARLKERIERLTAEVMKRDIELAERDADLALARERLNGMTQLPEDVPAEVDKVLSRGQRLLLGAMLHTPGRVVKFNDLLDAYLVDHRGEEPYPRVLTVQISLMNRKLHALYAKHPLLPRVVVENVWGVGYKARVVK